ncbi:MAG TPA: PH domain-containing protein [Pseudoclavibacter sp.]|nr:PH domain-containing protein [Pseudoclavibacter sp.]
MASTVAFSETPASPPEVSVAVLRRHARHMIPAAIVLVGCAGAGAYWGGHLAPSWGQGWLGWAIAAAGVMVFLFAWARWLARRYVLTTRKISLETGVLFRRSQEVLHSRVLGCRITQSPLQRVCRSGNVRIDVAGGSTLVLTDVPRVRVFVAAVQELQAAADAWVRHEQLDGDSSAIAP